MTNERVHKILRDKYGCNKEMTLCPKCSSTNVKWHKLLKAPYRFHCQDCGHKFV